MFDIAADQRHLQMLNIFSDAHGSMIESVAVYEGGALVATGAASGTIKLWNLESDAESAC